MTQQIKKCTNWVGMTRTNRVLSRKSQTTKAVFSSKKKGVQGFLGNLETSVLYLFYFPSQWYVQRELVGGYDSQVMIWSHRTSIFQEIISSLEPLCDFRDLTDPTVDPGFCFLQNVSLWNTSHTLVICMVSKLNQQLQAVKMSHPQENACCIHCYVPSAGDSWQGGL